MLSTTWEGCERRGVTVEGAAGVWGPSRQGLPVAVGGKDEGELEQLGRARAPTPPAPHPLRLLPVQDEVAKVEHLLLPHVRKQCHISFRREPACA